MAMSNVNDNFDVNVNVHVNINVNDNVNVNVNVNDNVNVNANNSMPPMPMSIPITNSPALMWLFLENTSLTLAKSSVLHPGFDTNTSAQMPMEATAIRISI